MLGVVYLLSQGSSHLARSWSKTLEGRKGRPLPRVLESRLNAVGKAEILGWTM